MLTLFPPGNSDPGWCHIPGARLSVPGLRELGACGRQCAPKMDLGISSSLRSPQPPVTGRRN